MKTNKMILPAMLALLLPGCSSETLPENGLNGRFREETLHPVFPGTRVSIDDAGVFSWSDEDDVAIHRSSSGYETAPLTEDGCFNIHLSDADTRDGYVLYPARIADESAATGDNIKVTLPATYTIPTAGMNELSPLPMIAKNDPESEDIYFQHLGGVLRLSLNNVPYETASLHVNMGKRLTGSFSVSNAGTESPFISTDSAEGEDITFTLSVPSSENRNGYILNIPVPTGTYPSLTVSAYDFHGNLLATGSDTQTRSFERAEGLRATLGMSIDARYIPLTIKAYRTGIVTISNPLGKTIQYSRDNASWTTTSEASIVLPLEREECVYLRGNNATYSSSSASTTISCSNYCYVYGNIMSLVDPENYATATELTGDYTFYNLFNGNTNIYNHPSLPLLLPATKIVKSSYRAMFKGCTALVTAPEVCATELSDYACYEMFANCSSLTNVQSRLPAMVMATNCYAMMFYYCRNVLTAPELPALTLASYCYSQMIMGCNAITEAPALPATTLAPSCYSNMLCSTSIVTPPELPATTLATSCYSLMFQNCTKMLTAPELPATQLVTSCYQDMFRGCSSLQIPPELPATEMKSSCYNKMFELCSSLVRTPDLPSTSLESSCYYEMFLNCKSLVSVTDLPATDLADKCYSGMFSGCTSLSEAPDLPATTLKESCYQNMFNGCTSLTSAPDLPATELVSYCYYQMFNGCTNLNHVKAMFTTKPESAYTFNWLNGVASTGTFVKNAAATWNVTGANGIPSGWTVQTATN